MAISKYEALKSIFEVEGISDLLQKNKICDPIVLLNTLTKESYCLATDLGVSPYMAGKLVKYLWPEKPNKSQKVCTYLLSKYELKYCSNCKSVKEIEEFSKNSSRPTGYNTHCKECYKENTRDYQREYQRTRKALKNNRIPSWANILKIREIYSNCPEGFHVDHIVPLQGNNVCGFHVENNLQYLPALENLKKGNKF